MARTTGYITTALANLLLEGILTEKSALPPKKIGSHPTYFEYIIDYFQSRNVHYAKTSTVISFFK